MSRELIVQFVGFESGVRARIYTFTVREHAAEPRDFTLTISNDNHPPVTRLDITDGDLEAYRSTHARGKPRYPFARKPSEDY